MKKVSELLVYLIVSQVLSQTVVFVTTIITTTTTIIIITGFCIFLFYLKVPFYLYSCQNHLLKIEINRE